jgi:hypothetical protein
MDENDQVDFSSDPNSLTKETSLKVLFQRSLNMQHSRTKGFQTSPYPNTFDKSKLQY